MANTQVKNSSELKRAPRCRHTLFDWDCCQFCLRVGRKLMVTTCVLKRKIASHVCNFLKVKRGNMVSREIEDALLGVECHPRSVPSNTQPKTEENVCDPLEVILKRLVDLQGQMTSLKTETARFLLPLLLSIRKKVKHQMKILLYMTLLTQKSEIGHLHHTTQKMTLPTDKRWRQCVFVRTHHSW